MSRDLNHPWRRAGTDDAVFRMDDLVAYLYLSAVRELGAGRMDEHVDAHVPKHFRCFVRVDTLHDRVDMFHHFREF